MFILAVVLSIIAVPVIVFLCKSGTKFSIIGLLVVMLGVTGWICASSPVMHKPFSINIIEYLIKINDDGSMSTTKQTTQTIIHKQSNGENR